MVIANAMGLPCATFQIHSNDCNEFEFKFINNFNCYNYWSCSVDHTPSDEDLIKVLQEHLNWKLYTIPLGLKSEQLGYFYCML